MRVSTEPDFRANPASHPVVKAGDADAGLKGVSRLAVASPRPVLHNTANGRKRFFMRRDI
jgi:hypothetical protein